MKASETYNTLARRIRKAKEGDALRSLETRIDRHYRNGTISPRELSRLDAMIMTRLARLD